MIYRHEEFTDDQIRDADSVDIVGFLQSQGETVSKEYHEYKWERHDSVKINPDKNIWCQHSTKKRWGNDLLYHDFLRGSRT